jgi:membrane associated rhomboid family serine protease
MVYFFIGITVLISFLAFSNHELFDRLKFNAYIIKHRREGWRFFTYGLVHAGWGHLFINMFVLFSFGDLVESYFKLAFPGKGILYFILLYMGGVLFSVLFDFRKYKDDIFYNAVGASGAVSAIVFSSILIHPTGKIFLFLIPIPLPSFVFGILYLVYSAYMSKNSKDNIGHSAHFWGAIYGVVFTIVVQPSLVTNIIQLIFG